MEKMIGMQVGMLSNLIKRQIVHVEPIPEAMCGMTTMQAKVIRYLRESETPRFQRDIETMFLIRRSTATGILKLMEQHELLRREPVAHDARLKRLMLTEKAISLDECIGRRLEDIEARLRQGLTAQEITQFLDIVQKMRHNLV